MRWFKRLLTILVILVVSVGAYFYFEDKTYYPSTEDAYVHAHVVDIAPRVTGHIVALPVRDNTLVQTGQLLLQIDPRSYRYALEQAEANLALAQRQTAALQAQVAQAQAHVAQNIVTMTNAVRNAERARTLAAQKYLSQQQADDQETQARAAQASVRADRANLAEAEANLKLNGARIGAAEAAVAQARLDLSECNIYAPTTGIVTKVDKIHVGDVAQANQPLFPLIATREYWVDANFKETDMSRMRPGQKARVLVDMWPGHPFDGIVESISGGAGNAFSLLPPENATGNWVKVTQRVPVRVLILHPDPRYPLRIGTSANVTIDTGGAPAWLQLARRVF